MRILGLSGRYREKFLNGGGQLTHGVVLPPEDDVSARWIEMAKYVGVIDSPDGSFGGADDEIDMVSSSRSRKPMVQAFVVMLKMITEIGDRQRTVVSNPETLA